MSHWAYEPKRYSLDHWQPDFYFATGYIKGLLEIKPVMPTPEYLEQLADASKQLKLPVYLGYEDFYNGVPRIQLIGKPGTDYPLPDSPYFPRIAQAVQTACHYRFDLPDQPTPPWRQAVVGEFEHNLSSWAKDERRRNSRRSRKQST